MVGAPVNPSPTPVDPADGESQRRKDLLLLFLADEKGMTVEEIAFAHGNPYGSLLELSEAICIARTRSGSGSRQDSYPDARASGEP